MTDVFEKADVRKEYPDRTSSLSLASKIKHTSEMKLDKRDEEFLKSLKGWPENAPYPSYDFKTNFINECIIAEDKNIEVNAEQSATALEYLKSCLEKDDSEFLKYILNPFEFWTHIYVDLFNGLQKIYCLKFKDAYDWETFIDVHFNDLKVNVFNCNFKNAAIVKSWSQCIDGNVNYFLILAGISVIDKELFDEITMKLKNK